MSPWINSISLKFCYSFFHQNLLINKKYNLIKNKLSLPTIKSEIFKLGASNIDYIEILDINKIIRPYKKINKYKIYVASYLGTTRLIDNIEP